MKGKFLTDISELEKAYEEFRYVLAELKQVDSYALIGQGNINYEWSTRQRENLQSQELLLKKAMDKYMNVLEFDEANCFAALGVANVLAEHNKLTEAMEVYKVLKENNPNMYHALLNQAHLQVELGNYESAINLYKKSLELFPGGMNLEIELYLAKVYYKMKSYD